MNGIVNIAIHAYAADVWMHSAHVILQWSTLVFNILWKIIVAVFFSAAVWVVFCFVCSRILLYSTVACVDVSSSTNTVHCSIWIMLMIQLPLAMMSLSFFPSKCIFDRCVYFCIQFNRIIRHSLIVIYVIILRPWRVMSSSGYSQKIIILYCSSIW